MNMDGELNAKDAQVIMDLIVTNGLYTTIGDLNGDGIIWIEDFGVLTDMIKNENMTDLYATIVDQARP